MTAPSTGWGSAPWGSFPWGLGGGSSPSSAALASAVPIRENVVQLFFEEPLEFTGLFDSNDAGDPSHYQVEAIAGTVGRDGRSARPVGVILAEEVPDDGLAGSIVNLTLDRPLSPYPAQYVVTVRDLVTATAILLTPTNATATFYGTQQPAPDLAPGGALPTRDFAHPDDLGASLDPLPNALDPAVLGTIPIDSSGDYAVDEGIVTLRKRIFRRLSTIRGRFLHLGRGYGVGVQASLKRLSIPAVRQQMAAEAEVQILQEPDVARVRVRIVADPNEPSLARFIVLVKPTVGRPVKFDVPMVVL